MKLFFDSGATKCACLLLDNDGNYMRHFTDRGFNVTYATDDTIAEILGKFARQLSAEAITHVTFSGAGCGNATHAARLRQQLQLLFPHSQIEVISDLLGACRVLSPDESSIVAILGTGSSACFFDGKAIVQQAPSLGYILGDEGSGTHIGKLFITSYLQGTIPADLQKEFEETFQLSRTEILRHIYQEPAPNLFFSSFARYLATKKNNPAIHPILWRAFSDFFDQQIAFLKPSNSLQLNLMGSVGFYFQDIIQLVAAEYHIQLCHVAASPLDYFLHPVNL